ncbi:MAG: hypothetical protein KF819_33400, partial [Labilithrix sp.]|nr:hypothetical protein [Labilithrix sp.]
MLSLRDGVPDPSFGTGGWFHSTLGDGKRVALAVAPDGRIYIAAGPGLHVQRLMPDGSVDLSCGTLGTVTHALPSAPALAVVDHRGALLVAMDEQDETETTSASVVRLSPTGSLDGAFASGGRAALPAAYVHGIALQST